jgi:DNA-binding NarL/FixJ family response regulator
MVSYSGKTVPDTTLRILLVGNNPIELSRLRELLRQIPGYRVMDEIAFDLQSTVQRLWRFKPHFILIDDNIGKDELAQTVQALATHRKTRDVPVAVLKNSNYSGTLTSSVPLDYLLKQNITAEQIMTAVKNAFKLKMARQYLAKAYAKRRKQLLKFIR